MRKLSTILMRVYNSRHYMPENAGNFSTGIVSGYLCNAASHAATSGVITTEECEELRRAIRKRLEGESTLSAFLSVSTYDSKPYAKAAMKFWRGWRRELQAAGK